MESAVIFRLMQMSGTPLHSKLTRNDTAAKQDSSLLLEKKLMHDFCYTAGRTFDHDEVVRRKWSTD